MDNALFALAAPALVSTANAASKLASTVAQPFATVLNAVANAPSEEADVYAEALQELSQQAHDLATNLENRVRDTLQASGIQIEAPLRLRISAFDGQIELVDSHPQRAILEAALNNNSQLVEDFQKYSAVAGYFEAGQDAMLLLEPKSKPSLFNLA